MTEAAAKFMEKWHQAISERSLEKVENLLAPDIQLISPIAFKIYTDRNYILLLHLKWRSDKELAALR
jgi:hypothetical protein